VELRPNPNFYGVPTTSDFSAIHVPTSIYNRGNDDDAHKYNEKFTKI
jgi:hypothetical protein